MNLLCYSIYPSIFLCCFLHLMYQIVLCRFLLDVSFLHSKNTQMYSTALHSFCMTIMRFLMLLLLHIILYPVDICVYKPNCMHVTTQRKRIPLLLLYFLSYGNYFYLLSFLFSFPLLRYPSSFCLLNIKHQYKNSII